MEQKIGQEYGLPCITALLILQMEQTPTPHSPLTVYLAEVMAFICVLDQHSFHFFFFFFKQGHHLPPATIPVKESILQMLARLQDELSDQENKNKHIL